MRIMYVCRKILYPIVLTHLEENKSDGDWKCLYGEQKNLKIEEDYFENKRREFFISTQAIRNGVIICTIRK